MVEVTSEVMYKALKIQSRPGADEQFVAEHHNRQNAVWGPMASTQADTANIYGVLSRHGPRPDRIEGRLELREFAKSQRPFGPST